jgi:pimeloyl-ACP methyl ester carboxylesterase
MKLFYRKYGSGPPLIILHGLFGSGDNWVTVAKSLSENFTVYLPDQRNHGQSPHSETHDYNSMRDDLFELANDLALKKFFLVGHSMGGKTAIAFALKWPEMLNGLLIADISPFSDAAEKRFIYSEHHTILEAILSIDLKKVLTRNDADTLLSEKIESEKTRGMIMKNLQRTGDNSFSWKINAASLFKNLDKIMEGIERRDDYNHQITGFPVIFLKGGDSDYIPGSDFKDILKVFPAAELIEIPGAGHWINSDKPEEVVENIKKLLA